MLNIYGTIILGTLIFSFIISLITEILNLKALRDEVPEEFKGVYDEEAYRNSQEYTRVKTKFGFITSVFGLAVTLTFWFTGGFNYLDRIVRSWELHPIFTGLVYIGILILAKSLLSLPFSIYSTFVIEERFGFNKTTPRTFITDILKGLLLGIVLGGPLLAGVLAFFQYAGTMAWVYCWLATTVFTLFVQFIAPTWIMPLFNKFTPLEEGKLREAIFNYARAVKFPLKNLFVMDGSKRSTKSNAFFTGFGKNKRIALFDTLIEKHTVAELVNVVAHEIGHYKKKHIIQGTIISILHTGVMFFLLSIFISHEGLFEAFYMEQTSIYAGLIFFGMLYSPIELVLSIFMQIFSRKNEYEADRFAAETTNDPTSMIDALKKLSRDNLSNLTPHRLYVFLNYSHPPVLQRIRALQELALA
ncbi:M48 family metalloprotease [candidate division KSB1 bacterium]|nr:M48 family metalloprotease [candidate division KSB1 bacterium]